MREPIPNDVTKTGNLRIKNFALDAIDFYKAGHRNQYPDGTTSVYSNFTPRSVKHLNVEKDLYDGLVVFFGLQSFIKSFLQESFGESFFDQPLDRVLKQYKRRMDTSLFTNFDVSHIESLHNLGYLPIRIKALPEGAKVRPGVPVFTIVNTKPEFFWLTNYLESVLSAEIWKKMVNATVASHYRGIFEKYARETASPMDFVYWQGHDFSMRGMSGWADAASNGQAHLTSFYGTDSVSAIDELERLYGANADVEIVGASVPATEHSVMCMGGMDDEHGTFLRLITKLYPAGIVSIVSDTWDFWNVISVTAPSLKAEIMARDGKVVFRPDSGDPVKIICGDPDAPINSNEWKGAVRILDEQFGHTETERGFKILDSHVGLIYGDSITPKRANQILHNLAEMGYASCNCVFGIGSYTYNYSTRDSIGGAMKSTSGVVNGVRRAIFKDPKTDNGIKKSAKGLLRVEIQNGEYVLFDDQTEEQEMQGELKVVFEDGKLIREVTLAEIRARLIK
jgi:nicotinamide phosphoribosyltransferase